MNIFLGLLLVLSFLSCSKKKSQPLSPADANNVMRIIDASEVENIDEFLREQVLNCSARKCPEGIAKLVTLSVAEKQFGVCSSFLIAPDVIMTNSHCLMNLDNQEFCDSANFYFSNGRNKRAERRKCKAVINRHQLNPNVVDNFKDYAFIKIEKTNRKPLAVNSKEGFKNMQRYAAWVVEFELNEDSPVQSLNYASIVRKECLAVKEMVLAPHFQRPNSNIVGFTECPVIAGNSGSPILNENDQVVGIIFGGMNQDTLSEEFDMKKPELALAVNFTCVYEESDARFLKPHCHQKNAKDALFDIVIQKKPKDLLPIDQVDTLKVPVLENIQFQEALSEDFSLIARPDCFRSDLSIEEDSAVSQEKVNLPLDQVEVSLNRFYQIDSINIERLFIDYHLSYAYDETEKALLFKLSYDFSQDGEWSEQDKYKVEYSLPSCTLLTTL